MSKISDYLLEVVKAKKKGLASRIAKRVGSATFKELSILLQSFKISNDSNRDVELEEKDTLLNKLSHLIRFVSGISSKSQMLITVLRNGLDDVGSFPLKSFPNDGNDIGFTWVSCNRFHLK